MGAMQTTATTPEQADRKRSQEAFMALVGLADERFCREQVQLSDDRLDAAQKEADEASGKSKLQRRLEDAAALGTYALLATILNPVGFLKALTTPEKDLPKLPPRWQEVLYRVVTGWFETTTMALYDQEDEPLELNTDLLAPLDGRGPEYALEVITTCSRVVDRTGATAIFNHWRDCLRAHLDANPKGFAFNYEDGQKTVVKRSGEGSYQLAKIPV